MTRLLMMVLVSFIGFAGSSGRLNIALSQSKGSGMNISSKPFGKMPDGKPVVLFTLTNPGGMNVTITNYGATVTGIRVPDRRGRFRDVVLGFSALNDYVRHSPYFGCIVGRYANRIAKGKFILDGKEYSLARNDHENHLHGGVKGFDKVLWNSEKIKTSDSVGVKFTYMSRDGDEGYPGNLTMKVWYWLNNRNELHIDYEGMTDAPTIVNCSHHSYFNLGDSETVLGHRLMIKAGRYTVVDSGLIPTGELRPVDGTPLDFRLFQPIGARIGQVAGGYDHNFVLDRKGDGLELAAKVIEPASGRSMEVWTTEPGLQFYSGNFLDGSLKGKNGRKYPKHGGFCLEAQHFPDSPNHPEFPSVVLRPGEMYRQTTIYKFSVEK